jgi:hypothetical protein
MALFAPSDGIVKSIEVDPVFSTKLFDIKMLNGPSYRVTDHLGDKLGMLYYTICEDEAEWFRKNMRDMFHINMEE